MAAPPFERGINFAGTYKGVSDEWFLRQATEPDSLHSLPMRLFLLACSRANYIGHAEFQTGEIGKMLQAANRRTGEVQPSPKNRITDSIAVAKARGLLEQSSTARCLVLYPQDVQNGKGARRCKHHGLPLRAA